MTQAFRAILRELGGSTLFMGQILRTLIRTERNGAAILSQVAEVSMRSLGTVLFAGVFVGAILVLQFNEILAKYDAQIFLGGLNTSSVVREAGPLIISFLLAGKVGAFTAAELGTMRVTEQIDAIECLGINSIQYLIVPRFFGIALSSLILLFFGLFVSVLGALGVATAFCGVNALQFLGSIPRFVNWTTLAGGMIRSFVYGTIVALVSCHQGYKASGGARGVGRAVTAAAVYTNLFIIFANYVLGSLFATWGGD